jgi:hypothetical protein
MKLVITSYFLKFAAVAAFLGLAIHSDNLHAVSVSFSTEFNSGGDPKVSLDNRSDAGWFIESIKIDFTTANVVLDTTAGDGIGTDPVDEALAFMATGTNGSFATAVTTDGLAAYDNAGDLTALAADINAGGSPGQLMTFGFSSGGIAPGDGWGINVDWDETGSNDAPRGSDINGTTVMVTFSNPNIPNFTKVLTLEYSVSGNGVSFPGLISMEIPEPASLGLASIFLLGMMRRRQRQYI